MAGLSFHIDNIIISDFLSHPGGLSLQQKLKNWVIEIGRSQKNATKKFEN